MKIAVLFDGAGLARLGLELAGHTCTGFEIDPAKHALGRHVGSGNTVLADVKGVDLSGFDAVWASPPCQARSSARNGSPLRGTYDENLLAWSLALPHEVLWVENIVAQQASENTWGDPYNAAQFEPFPRQQRSRIIGGRYPQPFVFAPYKKLWPGVCPTVVAQEYKAGTDPISNKRRAARFYGRRMDIDECAFHQGLPVPEAWRTPPVDWAKRPSDWMHNVYEAIGNGVPVYMAQAFGQACSPGRIWTGWDNGPKLGVWL